MEFTKDPLKPKRFNTEDKRIRVIYKDLDKSINAVMDGLIRRAAYMRVTLEDYEKDLDENGYIEMFSQSEKTDPYERERPVARLYNTMNKNYQSIMKQVMDQLPKGEVKVVDDGFDAFINNRND